MLINVFSWECHMSDHVTAWVWAAIFGSSFCSSPPNLSLPPPASFLSHYLLHVHVHSAVLCTHCTLCSFHFSFAQETTQTNRMQKINMLFSVHCLVFDLRRGFFHTPRQFVMCSPLCILLLLINSLDLCQVLLLPDCLSATKKVECLFIHQWIIVHVWLKRATATECVNNGNSAVVKNLFF